jgi:uncharacterized protein
MRIQPRRLYFLAERSGRYALMPARTFGAVGGRRYWKLTARIIPRMDLPPDFLLYVLIGFAAQLIDGALGMAYGVTASSLLLGFGVPPAVSSATVHAAECFTTGTSAISHHAFGNIDRKLFRRLLLPGMLGAGIGAYLLTTIDGEMLKPWIAGYLLLMGIMILFKSFRELVPKEVTSHISALGFFGALMDAIGGGGWGPIVASNLIARGHELRLTVGSVNAVEFFVTLTASIVFLLTMGTGHLGIVLGLALGGVVAAPFGAWLLRYVRPRLLMPVVGVLVIGLSVRILYHSFAG